MNEAPVERQGVRGTLFPAKYGLAVRTHWLLALSAAFCVFVFCWFVTQGSWHFFEREPQGNFYDAQAKSLLDGRWDVPYVAIAGEAFPRNGKFYGYFGFTPALFRFPVMALFPSTEGRWGRWSLLGACLVNILMSLLLFRAARKDGGKEGEEALPARSRSAYAALFMLLATLGSTHIFLATRAFMYHEAMMWGSTLALVAYYLFIRYTSRPAPKLLAGSCLAAGLAFFARVPSGVGPLLIWLMTGLFFIFRLLERRFRFAAGRGFIEQQGGRWRAPAPGHPARSLLLLSVFGALILGGYVGQNYGKFGRVWTPLPVAMNEQYKENPERMQRMQGRLFHLQNAAVTLPSYLSPTRAEWDRHFPWVHLTRHASYLFPVGTFDFIRPFAGLPATTPALFLLSAWGAYTIFRKRAAVGASFRLPVVGALVSGSFIFFFIAITFRYVHDLYPLLLLGAAAGLKDMAMRPPGRRKRALLGGLALLSLYSVYANVAIAYEYQRALVWHVPEERRIGFRETRAAFDALLAPKPLRVLKADFDSLPMKKSNFLLQQMAAYPVLGQLRTVRWRGQKALYYYNGKEWVRISGRPLFLLHVKMRVVFAASSGAEPLVTVGPPQAGLMIYVHYGPKNTLSYGCAPRSLVGRESKPVPVQPGRAYVLDLLIDILNRRVRLRVDGVELLSFRAASMKLQAVYPIHFGANEIQNPAAGTHFSGQIVPLRSAKEKR